MSLPVPASFIESPIKAFRESPLKQRLTEYTPISPALYAQVLHSRKLFPGIKRFTFSDLPSTPNLWSTANVLTYLTRYQRKDYSGEGYDEAQAPWSFTSADTLEGTGFTPQNSGMYSAADGDGTPTTSANLFNRWPFPWNGWTGYPVHPSGVTVNPTNRSCAGRYVLINNTEWAETYEELSVPADIASHLPTMIDRLKERSHQTEIGDFGTTGLPSEFLSGALGVFDEYNPGTHQPFDTAAINPADYDMGPDETTATVPEADKRIFFDNVSGVSDKMHGVDYSDGYTNIILSGWIYPTSLVPQEGTNTFGSRVSEPYSWSLFQQDYIYGHRTRFCIPGLGYRSYFIVKAWIVADYPNAVLSSGAWSVPMVVYPKMVLVSEGSVNENNPVSVPLPTGGKFNTLYEPCGGGKVAIGAACFAIVGEDKGAWLVRNGFEFVDEESA